MTKPSSEISRRDFLKVAAGAACTVLAASPTAFAGQGASKRRVLVLGIDGMDPDSRRTATGTSGSRHERGP